MSPPPAPANRAPSASITAPADGSSFMPGVAVSFAGRGIDSEDGKLSGASLVWTSSVDGQIATGETVTTSTLSVGTHTITLTATDRQGSTGTGEVTVKVAPNQNPTARITLPADSLTFNPGDAVTFAGRGIDPEDGELSGASLVWTSSVDGQIATGGRFTTSTLGVGTHTITLTATDTQGATGTASIRNPVQLSDSFLRNYVEAIFLGSGPLIPRDGFTACAGPGIWAAFPLGSVITVVLSSSLDRGGRDGVDTKQLIRDAVQDLPTATHGLISATVIDVADPDPLPNPLEATATDHPDPVSTGCTFDRGCVHISLSVSALGMIEIESSRTTINEAIVPADAYVHDVLGHGILGMCHIDQQLIGGNDKSIMAGGPGGFSGLIPDRLSQLDIAAAQAVYGAGLSPGASRDDFVRAGLVDPLPAAQIAQQQDVSSRFRDTVHSDVVIRPPGRP